MMISNLLLAWTNLLLYVWRWFIIIDFKASCRWVILGLRWVQPLCCSNSTEITMILDPSRSSKRRFCMSMMISNLLLAWTNLLLYEWRWFIIIGSEVYCRWVILGTRWVHALHCSGSTKITMILDPSRSSKRRYFPWDIFFLRVYWRDTYAGKCQWMY